MFNEEWDALRDELAAHKEVLRQLRRQLGSVDGRIDVALSGADIVLCWLEDIEAELLGQGNLDKGGN